MKIKGLHTLLFKIEQNVYVGENVLAYERLRELRNILDSEGLL